MKPPTWRWLGLLAAGPLVGCGGEPITQRLEEPIRISGAQFRAGPLPGLPPLSARDLNEGARPMAPFASGISLQNTVIPPREPGRTISGLASPGSVAVALRFADLGSGYWIVPTRGADAVNDNALEWRISAAFGGDLPPGKHALLFAALDEEGHAGNQVELSLCLEPEIPDNGSTCDPAESPPALVVSLAWQGAVDLDLRVITPTGKVVDSKHPTTGERDDDGKVDTSAAGTGVIAYDSFSGCVPDGFRRENLVFQAAPPPGTYLAYANLFDACGQSGASFALSVSRAEPDRVAGTIVLQRVLDQTGEIQAIQANGGADIGLFVTSFRVR